MRRLHFRRLRRMPQSLLSGSLRSFKTPPAALRPGGEFAPNILLRVCLRFLRLSRIPANRRRKPRRCPAINAGGFDDAGFEPDVLNGANACLGSTKNVFVDVTQYHFD